MLYSNQTKWTKFNERTNTLLYKNISLILFSKMSHSFLLLWEIDGATCTQREDFYSPYRLPGARERQCLHPTLQARQRRPDRLRVLRSTPILCLCRNLTARFSSCGLLPVTHLLYLSALMYCHIPVFSSLRDSLSKHTGHLERTENSCHMLYNNIYIYIYI